MACTGPRLGAQYPHGGSRPPATSIPVDAVLHAGGAHTHRLKIKIKQTFPLPPPNPSNVTNVTLFVLVEPFPPSSFITDWYKLLQTLLGGRFEVYSIRKLGALRCPLKGA